MSRTNVATITIFYENELSPHLKDMLEEETVALANKLAERATSGMVVGFHNKADADFLEALQHFVKTENQYD